MFIFAISMWLVMTIAGTVAIGSWLGLVWGAVFFALSSAIFIYVLFRATKPL